MDKALGKLEAEGDASVSVFTLSACTKLPHQSLHKSGVGGNAWGTSRAQRTFCSLAAPCASPPNVLSYLASSELHIFMSAACFYWVFVVPPFMTGKLCVSSQLFRGCRHQALPEVTDGFALCCKGTKHAATGECLMLPELAHGEEWSWLLNSFNCSALRKVPLCYQYQHKPTCISLRTWQNSVLSLQHWAHQAALLCAHQSHLTPLRLQIKSFFPSYISIISILMKFLTSFTSLAFAPCKKKEARRAGGFLSTAKGSSNSAAFREVAEVAYKWLNWTRFLPQCTASICVQGMGEETLGKQSARLREKHKFPAMNPSQDFPLEFLQDVHALCAAEPLICWMDKQVISKNVSDVRHLLFLMWP